MQTTTPLKPFLRQLPNMHLLALAVAMVIGLALRLFGLTREGFWTDELYVIHEARQPLEMLFDPNLHIQHPPGYRLALHVWLGLGLDETWIRLLPALAGLLLIPATWGLARLLWPTQPWAASIAAIFVATSPFLLHYSQDITTYSWTALWITTSMIALVLAWRTDRGVLWAVWAITLAVSMYSHYFSLFPILVEILAAGLVGGRESRHKLLRASLSVAAALALFVPWMWVLLTRGQDTLGLFLFPLSMDRQLLQWLPPLMSGYSRPQFWVQGTGFTLAWLMLGSATVWGAWRLVRNREWSNAAGAALVSAWGLAAYVGPYLFLRLTTPPDAIDPVRFAALAAPALVLGLGAVVSTLPAPVRAIAVGAWLVLAGVQWQAELRQPPKQDWRGIMGTIADEARTGDVLLAFTAFHAGTAAAYYPVPIPVQGGWFVSQCGETKGEGAAYWFPQDWRWRGFLETKAYCSLDLRGDLARRTREAKRVWYLAGDGADGTYPPKPAAEALFAEMGWRQAEMWQASPLVLRLYVKSQSLKP